MKFADGQVSKIILSFFYQAADRMELSLIETEKFQQELVDNVPIHRSFFFFLYVTTVYILWEICQKDQKISGWRCQWTTWIEPELSQ